MLFYLTTVLTARESSCFIEALGRLQTGSVPGAATPAHLRLVAENHTYHGRDLSVGERSFDGLGWNDVKHALFVGRFRP